MSAPRVTALVSTYNAERFICSCLDDLVNQTIFNEMEVIIIDSGSTQRESELCRGYIEKFPQIELIRTERESLYTAWNRAISLAKGKYLTSANTDDRHRSDYAETLADVLEANPDVALVYGDQYISDTENEDFTSCHARRAPVRRWPEFTPIDLMLRCITGSQPMWRRSLHESLGLFSTQYRIAGDYDMWLRIATQSRLLHIPEVLGVFFDSPDTISGSSNRLLMDIESLRVKRGQLLNPYWMQLPGLRRRLAEELFGVGYRYIKNWNDAVGAAPFLRESVRLDPLRLKYLKTYLIRCVMKASF